MSDERDSRRDFLHRTGGCFVAALVSLGLPGENLWALPVGEISSQATGHERAYPVPPVDGISIDHAAQVILVRSQGRVFAFALSCPHQNAAVKWVDKDHRFQCTKHDSRYEPDGVHISGRATRNMDRFPIRRDAAGVLVDISRVFHSDQDPAGWQAASVGV